MSCTLQLVDNLSVVMGGSSDNEESRQERSKLWFVGDGSDNLEDFLFDLKQFLVTKDVVHALNPDAGLLVNYFYIMRTVLEGYPLIVSTLALNVV